MEKNRIGTDWIDWNKSFRPKTWINRMKGIEKKKEEEKKKNSFPFTLPSDLLQNEDTPITTGGRVSIVQKGR